MTARGVAFPDPRPTTVWITRPDPAARGTALRLEALGHRALVAPVFSLVPVFEPLPPGPCEGVIVTSARAIDSLDAAGRMRLAAFAADAPIFAVGEGTAQAVRRAGFAVAAAGEGDAVALAHLVAGRLTSGARLLHIAGRDRKAEPEASLAAAGFSVAVWTTYAAQTVERLPAIVAEAFADERLRAVLHYSRRSAGAALALAEAAGRGPDFRALRHHCLSPDVAAPLVGAGVACHVVAARPSEVALLATLAEPGAPSVS